MASCSTPPAVTPMASPATGVVSCGEIIKAKNIIVIFSTTGAAAGAAKFPMEFKIPIHNARSDTQRI